MKAPFPPKTQKNFTYCNSATRKIDLFRAGRFDSPSKRLRNAADLFGNQLGDMRNLARGNYQTIPGDGDSQLQGFDERIRHSVAYRTPTLNGFSVEVLYSAEHQNNGDADDSNPNDAFSGALTFQMGGLYAALSHERWNNEDPDSERNVTRAAGSYDTDRVRVTAFVQRATDPADWVYSVGSRYALTDNMGLRAQYTMMDADDGDFDGQQISLGGDYQYSPELQFYANYAQLSNDEQLTQAPWREASTLGQRGAADETAHAFSLGAIYSF